MRTPANLRSAVHWLIIAAALVLAAIAWQYPAPAQIPHESNHQTKGAAMPQILKLYSPGSIQLFGNDRLPIGDPVPYAEIMSVVMDKRAAAAEAKARADLKAAEEAAAAKEAKGEDGADSDIPPTMPDETWTNEEIRKWIVSTGHPNVDPRIAKSELLAMVIDIVEQAEGE